MKNQEQEQESDEEEEKERHCNPNVFDVNVCSDWNSNAKYEAKLKMSINPND